MDIPIGAEVVDNTGKQLGKVDYIMRDTYTGEIKKFKVGTDLAEADLFFSPQDVAEATPSEVKLKVAYHKGL